MYKREISIFYLKEYIDEGINTELTSETNTHEFHKLWNNLAQIAAFSC